MKEAVFSIKQSFEQFASMIPGSVYILDITQKRICYAKVDELFLCDFSIEEVIRLGYDFYAQIIFAEDFLFWKETYEQILQYMQDNEEEQEKIDYFSCTFRLQRTLQFVNRPLLQTVYHRMKPVFINYELRYLICSMDVSTYETGSLRVHYKSKMYYSEYSFLTKRWTKKQKEKLTERERVILMLAQQGKSAMEMSEILCKGYNTIRNQIKALFVKLGKHTMLEALELARNLRIIYFKNESYFDK